MSQYVWILSISDWASVFAPQGQQDSARGFNPGFGISKEGALKVAPDRRRLAKMLRQYRSRSFSGATFRAHLVWAPDPGLKPWAESCFPFGADQLSLCSATEASLQYSELLPLTPRTP
jgi:hypothetical protein